MCQMLDKIGLPENTKKGEKRAVLLLISDRKGR